MTTKAIDDFAGKYRFMSNFSRHTIMFRGVFCPTVEHLFQASKTNDPAQALLVMNATGPGEAKRLGRRVSLRGDWEKIKERVMWSGLVAKFSQHHDIRMALLATGEVELIEGNTWHDNYWGDCYCGKLIECINTTGKNRLGEQLMMLREALSAMA